MRFFASVALLLLFLAPIQPIQAADPDITTLRIEQQQRLDALQAQYHAKVRNNPNLIRPDGTINTGHPDYQQTLADYAAAKATVQAGFSQQDPRGAELSDIQQTFGKDVDTTGSAPKDVRADLDITAKTPEAADAIVARWEANGDTVEYDPKLGIHVNKTKDATLWAPPTPEQLDARSTYADAFSTPGGKQGTGVKGEEAIRDKEGFVLDNEKKFIHSAGDLAKPPDPGADPTEASLARATALKTAGKSVSKAADSVGQTSEVARQADALRNYQDEFETGVTALGATPEQQQKDVQGFIEKADQQIQNSKAQAEQQSAVTKQTREDLAKQTEGKDKSPMVDADGKPLPTTSEAIRARNERVDAENAKAKAANEADRAKAGLGAAPPPNPEAVGTTTKPPTSPKPTTEEKEGTAKNAWWKTTTTRDGDTTQTTQITVTDTPEGGHQVTVKEGQTTRAPDGGKTTTQTTESTTLGKDGVTAKTTTLSTTQATKQTPGDGSQAGQGYISPTSKTQSQTASTGADGTTKQTTATGETGTTKGGGAVGSESTTTKQTGADGTTTQSTQKTSSYTGPERPDGKQTGVTTTHTQSTQTGADGATQSTTGKAVTHTTQDSQGGTTAKTTTQASTQQTGADGSTSSTKSTALGTQTTGAEGETQGHTFTTTKTTTTDASGRTSTTEGDATVDSDGKGAKTTATTTTTQDDHTTTKTGTWDWQQTHSGQDEDEGDKKPDSGPPKVGVKIAGGDLFGPVDEDGGRAVSTSGATDIGGVEVEGEGKVQAGQYGAKGTWEVTADSDGLKAKGEVSGEANLVKGTLTGSAQTDLTENISASGKVTVTGKVGAEGKVAVEGVVGPDKIAGSGEAKVFIGGKAELEAEAAMTFWGLKIAGKGQGEVSYGAGAEAKIEAELSWTKIKIGGKLAGTLGLGGGGSANIEIDATTLITGVDLDKVGQQMAAADGILSVLHGLKDGSLKLPPGKTFADIRDQMQKQAEWYAKHPQKDAKGKPIALADSLKKDLGLQKGKAGGYVTAHHQQTDWYCTNRPVITAPVALPPIVHKD